MFDTPIHPKKLFVFCLFVFFFRFVEFNFFFFEDMYNVFFCRNNDLNTEAEKRGTYLSMMYNIVSNCQCFLLLLCTHGNEK